MIEPFSFIPDIFTPNESIVDRVQVTETPYTFNGQYVPRVTSILSDMLHNDSLMKWSNYIGKYKHESYVDVLEQSAEIGTLAHHAIEIYLKTGEVIEFNNRDTKINDQAFIAFMSFVSWWEQITKNHKVTIVMQEEPLVCKYYGGTLDMLVNIDGYNYIVDFKTSNNIRYSYFLQLAAYKEILETCKHIPIRGVVILQLSKKMPIYKEVVLDTMNYQDREYLDACRDAFMSLVYAYYMRQFIEAGSKKYLG